jgi:prophage antirepressor-like protein
MTNTLPDTLDFEGRNLTIIDRHGVPHLAAADLARALGYANPRAITSIYTRHKTEFTESMSEVLSLSTKGFGAGASTKPVRVFSPRGAHLIAMFARTNRAAAFRRWVLDVLEGYTESAAPRTLTNAHARELQRAVATRAHALPRWQQRAEFKHLYSGLKNRFQVPTYRDVADRDFQAALEWIHNADLGHELPAPGQSTGQRYLVATDYFGREQRKPVPDDVCIVNPRDEINVQTFFREFVPVEMYPAIMKIGTDRLATRAEFYRKRYLELKRKGKEEDS